MKVLVLSPEKKDKPSRRRRQMIVRGLEGLGTELLNPMPGRPPRNKQSLPSLFPDIFYQQNAQSLGEAELVIADLTEPDFKIGFLISQSLAKEIPVLGLTWREQGEKPEGDKDSRWKEWREKDLFYFDWFNKTNARSVLRDFISYTKKRQRQWGRMIVIDGTDGSGKATQARLLSRYLKKGDRPIKYVEFPRYYSSFHGEMVGRYLKGEFGGLKEVNPYLASLFYALDRLTAKKELDDWLTGGCYVVANRYTSSNMGFQTARLPKAEQADFLNWLLNMEYKVHRLPKEDIVVILYVPVEIGQKLVDKKGDRGYVKGKKRDIYEENFEFLKKVEQKYLQLVDQFDHWVKVDCLDSQGKLLSRQEIHQKVVKALKSKNIID
jgi:dTMP kinase